MTKFTSVPFVYSDTLKLLLCTGSNFPSLFRKGSFTESLTLNFVGRFSVPRFVSRRICSLGVYVFGRFSFLMLVDFLDTPTSRYSFLFVWCSTGISLYLLSVCVPEQQVPVPKTRNRILVTLW